MSERTEPPRILVDADGCPVRHEIFRVARRHRLGVILVCNTRMNIPREDWIELVVVDDRFDAADDWIVDHVVEKDIVVTWDIPLAARCLEKGAAAISPKGRLFSENSIGDALANREVQSYLRELGVRTGGPKPFEKRDRSRFLHGLDEVIRSVIPRG